MAVLAGYLPRCLDKFTDVTIGVGISSALILLGLTTIQLAMVGALGRCVNQTAELENRANIPRITKRPEDLKNICGLTVQRAYKIVVGGMFLISLTLLATFVCVGFSPLGKCA